MEALAFKESLSSDADHPNPTDLKQETSESLDYNLLGILNFLQNEWSKMSIERSNWDYERAELQTKISLLQNERKGQENLKSDLVRRIKMLEFALQKERYKNSLLLCRHEKEITKLEEGLSCLQDDGTPTNGTESDDKSSWTLDRIRLQHDFEKFGLNDILSEIRSTRVKELLGNCDSTDGHLIGSPQSSSSAVARPGIDLKESAEKISPTVLNYQNGKHPPMTTAGIVDAETMEALAEFDLLVSQQDASFLSSSNVNRSSFDPFAVDISPPNNLSTEWVFGDQSALVDRLKEQYRLGISLSRSNTTKSVTNSRFLGCEPYESGDHYQSTPEPYGINKLPRSSDYERDLGYPIEGLPIPDGCQRSSVDAKNDEASNAVTQDSTLVFSSAIVHNRSSTLDAFGLGDLASLTAADEEDPKQVQSRASALDNLDGVGLHNISPGAKSSLSDECNDASLSSNAICSKPRSLTATWTAKYTLRSHFDSIRAILFHQTEQIILTASEDHTIKLWNLTKTVQAKRSSCHDVEPIYTCRGHNSPVLCLALAYLSESQNQTHDLENPSPEVSFAFSGSVDGEIRSWRFASQELLPYETFDSRIRGPALSGHSDSVWCLAARSDGFLLSASSDGTVRLWKILQLLHPTKSISTDKASIEKIDAIKVYRPGFLIRQTNPADSVCLPTSAIFLPTDLSAFAVGCSTGDVCLLSIESGELLMLFEADRCGKPVVASGKIDGSTNTPHGSVNCLIAHPTLPLLITAHENRQIRFLDTSVGSCVYSMVAHLDAVTSLAIDQPNNFLLSASHDSSIRIWDIESKVCIQELTGHRKKWDEAINCIAFHPSRALMASAGADGLAKVYV